MSIKSQFPVLLSVSISESDSAYQIHADVKEFNAENVTVSTWEDTLVIEMQASHAKNQSYYLGEPEYTNYRRLIPLGFPLCQDRIDSQFNKGTLTINVTKIVDRSVATRRTNRTSV